VNPDYFARNLSALSASNPAVAETIRNLPPGNRFRFERSAAGWLVAVDEVEGGVPLASLRDPLSEYREHVRRLAPKADCVPILLGFGSGYGFLGACLELGDRMSAALVVEPDPFLFRSVLCVLDLSKVLGSPGLRIALGQDVAEVEAIALEILPNLLVADRFVLKDQASWRQYESYLAAVEQALDGLFERAEAEARFFSAWGPQIQENVWRNAPVALTNPVLSDFQGCFQGCPAILVSGGPSLTRDLPDLLTLDCLPLIVAVDTAYPVLQGSGIEPHIVVTCDPTPLNRAHFDASDPKQETVLIFDPETFHEIVLVWRGPRSVLNAGESPTSAWLRELSEERVQIRKPISVAHAALEVALILGCDPVVLLGCDFAFNPHGGPSHVGGAALARKHAPIRDGQEVLNLFSPTGTGATASEPLVWVAGKRGGQVPASRTLALFAAEFGRRLAGSPVTVVDAGSGGAHLAGTVCRTFSEVRGLLTSRPVERRRISETFRQQGVCRDVLLSGLREEALSVLERAARQACEVLSQYCTETGVADRSSVERIQQAFWRIRRDRAVERVFGLALYPASLALVRQLGAGSPGAARAEYKSFFEAVLAAHDRLLPAVMALPGPA